MINFNTTHTNFNPKNQLAYRLGYSYMRMMIKSYSLQKAKEAIKKVLMDFSEDEQPIANIGISCALHQQKIRDKEASQEHSKEFNNGLATAEGIISFIGYKDALIEIREEIRISSDEEFVKGLKHALRVESAKQ